MNCELQIGDFESNSALCRYEHADAQTAPSENAGWVSLEVALVLPHLCRGMEVVLDAIAEGYGDALGNV